MYYSITLISIFEVLLEIVPMLLVIAFITVAERKTMASMQRRLGPNAVGQLKFNINIYFSPCFTTSHEEPQRFQHDLRMLGQRFNNRRFSDSLCSAAASTTCQPLSCNPD
jgi:hypothetical protein